MKDDPPPGKVWACPICAGQIGWNHRPSCKMGGAPIKATDALVAVYPTEIPRGR